MKQEKDKRVFVSLSQGEVLKCNRCGMFIQDQRINLRVTRDEAVTEVVCENCRIAKHE